MDDDRYSKPSGKDKLKLPSSGGGGAQRRGLRGGFIWVVLFLITLLAVSLFWNRSTGEVEILYYVFWQEVEDAKSAYEFVLPQISLEARMSPVENAYTSLTVSVRKVEDLVESLVLIGRPPGQCILCPGRSNALLQGRLK